MTVAEFNMMVEGYNEQVTEEITKAKYVAWWTASLVRAKKIPSLTRLLRVEKKEQKPIEEKRSEHDEIVKRFLKEKR